MISGSVTKEGKSVEEALQKALKQLGAEKEHVIIEVLSPGSKGMLGLGAKPAKVKISLKEEAQAERKLKHLLTDLSLSGHHVDPANLSGLAALNLGSLDLGLEDAADNDGNSSTIDEQANSAEQDGSTQQKVGTVEIKEGKLIVTNSVNDDMMAVIRIEENVRLTLNGQLVEEEAHVSEEDSLEIEIINDEPVSSLEFKISRNKMGADLKYINQPGATFRLKDQAPANKLTLLTEIENIVEPPTKTLEDLTAFLQEHEIVKGIDEEILKLVLETPNSLNSFQVARGLLPVDGIDATARYPFRQEENNEEDGSYFSRNRLISVNPGDVVAVKVPKIEGQDGWTITGEILPARPAMDCEITVKAGCELTEDGNSVVALISGRPVIEQSGQNISITVDPVYIVKEVSQAVGNINFAGDVEVQGNVGEGCVVQADGNIQVAGDVSRAVIRAGASVVLHKMVVASSVSAGGRAGLYASVLPAFKQIRELLDKASSDAKILKANSGAVSPGKPISDGMIIQFTIDSKYNNLPQTINGLWQAVSSSNISAHEEVVDFISLLRRNLVGLGPAQIEKVEFLDSLDNALDHIINMVENCMRMADYIKVRYVQNCSLMSSGDVIIEGQGCYISDIKAGGGVIICGKPGIARGVKIFADGDVTVADLGSEFESQTFVRVGYNGKITAELVHPDVVIQVGGEKFRVDKSSRSFTAYVDINGSGRLVVDRLTAEKK